MLPGPVFAFEMMTTARRGRFYSIRALYAIVLLLILWTIHSAWTSALGGEIPVEMMPWFGLSAFGGVTVGQEVLVLILTPALVAGAIADEKRRKTLHYLLASRLTGPEIVLGKLMVRMLYVIVVLGVSVPVLSLLVLLGGVDPMLVLLGCAGTLTTAWFLAALSIWVSTIVRRPREALFATFGLEGLWLMVPPLVKEGWLPVWPAVEDAVWWLADWVGASNPVMVFKDVIGAGLGIPSASSNWEDSLLWMIGLQAGFGAVLAILAAVQVRPIFRRQDNAIARPRGLRAWLTSRRLRKHLPLGDRPMLWKERHTGGARGFARIVGWLLTLILGGFLFYIGVWLGLAAFLEMMDQGYGTESTWSNVLDRWEFFGLLQLTIPLIDLLGMLIVAGSAAASITSEHEDDTWISLTATDLTGREIVLSKLVGSLQRPARLGSMIALLLIAGVGVGSLHWLSLPAVAVAVAVYAWFAAALGVWISLHLRSTWRAQFLTIALLLLVNVAGQGVLNMLSRYGFASQDWPGFTPYEIARLVMEPGFFRRFASIQWPRFWRIWDVDDGPAWLAIFSIMSLTIYAVLAALLTWHALRRYEIVAGRARRRMGS